jgi:hypothetical protein
MTDSEWIAAACLGGFALVLVVLLGFGAYLIIRDTRRGTGRWGVNFKAVRCPVCGEPCPTVRVPTSWGQAMWGGWTCTECSSELDKWGKVIAEGAEELDEVLPADSDEGPRRARSSPRRVDNRFKGRRDVP